jgi:glutamate 5-kinase
MLCWYLLVRLWQAAKGWVRHYARQIKLIQGKGYDVVLVSSGAVMAGRERLG